LTPVKPTTSTSATAKPSTSAAPSKTAIAGARTAADTSCIN
jgi:hypothetical protein